MERGSAFDLMPDEGASALAESDPYSTNLYVGNLAIGVDEDVRPCRVPWALLACGVGGAKGVGHLCATMVRKQIADLAESDPYSTNLYVGNLAIGVNEDVRPC